MKLLTKFALAGAALAASAGAYADVALPSVGIGQAVLFVKNELTGDVYARGIDLTADQVATQAAIVGDTYTGGGAIPDESLSFSLSGPIGPDANLTAFLGVAGAKSWAVMLGDSSGGINLGDKRAYGTSATGGFINTPSNTVLNQATAAFNTVMGSLNAALPDTGPNSIQTGGLWDQANSVQGSQADVWFNSSVGWNNKVSLVANQTAGFYLLTTSGGLLTAPVRQYLLGQLTLSLDGTLSSVSSVPLPPAIWMLGSALAGFAGLRRRRVDARVNGVAAA